MMPTVDPDSDGKLCWPDIVTMLNLTETPFLKTLDCNSLKARREYNKLVSHEEQLGSRMHVPSVGILRAAGLDQANQHLAKQFGALLIAANSRHLVAEGAITRGHFGSWKILFYGPQGALAI